MKRPTCQDGIYFSFIFLRSSKDLVHFVDHTLMDTNYILQIMCDLNVLPLATQLTNICGNVMVCTHGDIFLVCSIHSILVSAIFPLQMFLFFPVLICCRLMFSKYDLNETRKRDDSTLFYLPHLVKVLNNLIDSLLKQTFF